MNGLKTFNLPRKEVRCTESISLIMSHSGMEKATMVVHIQKYLNWQTCMQTIASTKMLSINNLPVIKSLVNIFSSIKMNFHVAKKFNIVDGYGM